ncbi:MAG: hypothetical protein WAO41_11015 [Candidatus Nanopelagicales bacterium]
MPGRGIRNYLSVSLTLGLTLGLGLTMTACSTSPEDTAASSTTPTASCDEDSVASVIQTDVNDTYPGATFVSLESFECADGWVYARALVDTSGVVVPTAFFLQTVDSTWVPRSISDICADPLDASTVPPSIYLAACGVPE